MRECARNGKMHNNRTKEKRIIKYNKSLITLKAKDNAKKHIYPQIKTTNRVIKIERTKNKRKYVYKDFERIMSKIIMEAKKELTMEGKSKLTDFIITLPTLRKQGDKWVDSLNRIIKHLKG